MKKRIIMITIIGLFLVMLPLMVGAEIVDSGIYGDNLAWTLDETGTLTISGTGTMTEYQGEDSPWYPIRDLITVINIEDGVTSIGGHAFSYCSNLESITISEDVISIGEAAFYGCSNLTNITIPDGVTSIEWGTFYDCSNLSSVDLPNGLIKIEDSAFNGCCNLMNMIVPNGLSFVGEWMVFEDCTVLYANRDSNAAKALGKAWYGFREPGTETDLIYRYEGNTLLGLSIWLDPNAVDYIFIPDYITYVDSSVLVGESNSPIIYANLDTDGARAISRSGFLFRVPETNCDIRYIFSGNNTIGIEVVNADNYATNVIIPDGATSICDDAFLDCIYMTSILIPDSITSIGVGGNFDHGPNIIIPTCNSYAHNWTKIYGFDYLVSILSHQGDTTIDPAVPATCIETGLTEGSHCSVCGEVLKAREVIPALGHNIVDVPAVAPTCTEAGKEAGRYCTRCDYVEEGKIIPALGHTEEIVSGWAATCEEYGMTEGKVCSVCGEVLVEQYAIPALGHKERVIPGKAATCEETGQTEGKVCYVCGKVLKAQEVIPALGHTEKIIPGKASTCVEEGLTMGKVCSVCGKVFVPQEVIPALPHIEKVIPGKAATCTEAGLTEGKMCSVCGEILVPQEVIPAPGHTLETDAAVPPTDTRPGLTEGSHCSVCGKILIEQQVLDPLRWGIEENNGSVTILRYYGSDDLLSIPERLEGMPVTAIAYGAFPNRNSPSCVYIPSCVTSINFMAFSDPVTVYCEEYTEADYWADDMDYTKVYTDNTDTGNFYTVSLPADVLLEQGQSQSLDAAVWPLTGRETMTWSSSDPDIVSVTDGTVTANQPGTATITLRVGGTTASVAVTAFGYPENFVLTDGNGDTGDLYVITKKTAQLYVRGLLPADARNGFEWTSSDTGVAVVNGYGKITAKRPGSAVITAAAPNGGTASIHVIVCYPVTEVHFGAAEYSLCPGKTVRVEAYVVTRDGTYENKLVSFSSSDENVAVVDRNGYVTGVSVGEAAITAQTDNGLTAVCKVIVREAKILILPESFAVIESEAFKGLENIDVIVLPAGVVQIASDAFDSDVVLRVPDETWAQWADDNGYAWQMQ